MKNILIPTLAMLFIVGCGGGSSSSKSKVTEADFNNTNAKYDLKEYLQEDSLVVYNVNLYTDSSGKKKYSDKNKVETFPTQKSLKTNNVISLKDGSEKETGTITIFANKLEKKSDSKTIEVVRKFDKHDVLSKSITTQTISTAKVELTRICKAKDILKTKEVKRVEYEDILEIECNTDSILIGKDKNVKDASFERRERIYLAKKKGIIFSESESCTSVTNLTLGQETKVKVCEKEIKEMLSFNKL